MGFFTWGPSESQQIENLMSGGMSRREARHLVRSGDKDLEKGKQAERRRQAIAKQARTARGKAAARARAERSGRGFFGTRVQRGNRREY